MNGAAETPADLPLRAAVRVPVEWLGLDRRNPRLVSGDGAEDDAAIIAHLYRGEALDELLQSIAANGYLDIEPLIVLRDDERLIVLEGNRRLAAVRLFCEPGLVHAISERNGLRIGVPEISDRRRATLDRVSVYRVARREDARAFIGFKHINGAAKWGSYAKARFAAEWYRAGGVSLDDIANRIGDKHDTVKRMVNAIYVLDQAKNTGKFDIDDRMSRRLNFSHFYTALSRGSYMEFLGLGPSWSDFALVDNPIPENRLEHLRKVLQWLYGSRSEDIRPVVVSQNPHVKQLGEVLASQEGLTVLETTGSLSDAYASVGTADQRFRDALLRARKEVRTAMGSLRGFDGQDESLVDIAEDVVETARAIHDSMRKKMSNAAVKGE